MKRLYLMRHAKAEAAGGAKKDSDRALTGEGKKDAREMGKRLKKMGVRPGIMISSSAVRAWETAKLAANEMGYPAREIIYNDIVYKGDVKQLLKLINDTRDTVAGPFIVGHNPGLFDFANSVLDQPLDKLPKGAVVCIEFGCRVWDEVIRGSGKKVFIECP